ncbi:unnamed protein product [Clavelina lepadiformis]|uniref:H-type lectin domain-containing protein n=1 Tax=Clavelina lepadiformis TaxID=159417 RepID=A0ABP0F498_CLALP
MATQEGSQLLSSSETNTKEWRLEFPIPFKLAPTSVQAKVLGNPRYQDKFQVQSVVPDEQGFGFVVKRTDIPTSGWGQSPTLTWVAVGDEQAAPTGSQSIGSSEFENLQVRVNFMNSLENVPKVYAWVRGLFQYQETFNVFGIKADVNGFSCTVKRTDKSHGWAQNPTIYYNLSG